MSMHELNLLENARESLFEALAKFEEAEKGEKKSYRFAVLHMAHFVELSLKHHIASKTPLLLHTDPFSKEPDRNRAIDHVDCINFIHNENPETISRALRMDLEWFKKLRHRIEHHKFTMDAQEARITLGRLFRSVMEFFYVHSDLDVNEHIPDSTKYTFDKLASEYTFAMQTAMTAVDMAEPQNLIDALAKRSSDPVRLDCPECGHFTLTIEKDSPTGFRCAFCKYEDSDEIPLNCDVCDIPFVRDDIEYWPTGDGGMEARCYLCSNEHFMKQNA